MARLAAALLALTGVAVTASSGSGTGSAPAAGSVASSILELDTASFADAVRAGDMLVEL